MAAVSPYERKLAEFRRRRHKALAMRKAGKTLQEIGDAFGVTKQMISKLVQRAERELA